MTYAGFSHLTFNRQEFVAQVPTWLQFSPEFTDFVVLASGVVEIALGLGIILLVANKRAIAGALLGLFYIAIFPGNINQYVNHIDAFGLNTDQARLIRLFFQPVLIFLALWTTNGWKPLCDTRSKPLLDYHRVYHRRMVLSCSGTHRTHLHDWSRDD